MSHGFDFTAHIERLCRDMVATTAELRHIDMNQVGVGFRQTRKPVQHGMYASLTPLRFENGEMITRRRGRSWRIERLRDPDGREILYVLNFYLPRFLDLPFREKLITIFHELWHIGPRFDGDLRRHAGRCYAHGSSKTEYDSEMECLLDGWLARKPPESSYAFLRASFRDLHFAHGAIVGRRWPRARLLPA
ncbi:MAG TPA: hypothetical protein VFE24_06440 [Pirellulales bacterium]|nr:hypothetical protein [Pirellulales bacterium]